VKKDWFKGLNPDPNDHSHPDVGDTDKESGGWQHLGEKQSPFQDVKLEGTVEERTPLSSKGEHGGGSPEKLPQGGDHQVWIELCLILLDNQSLMSDLT
jgi:hypothetical protein